MKDTTRLGVIIFVSFWMGAVVFIGNFLIFKKGFGYALLWSMLMFLLSFVTNVGVMIAKRRNQHKNPQSK